MSNLKCCRKSQRGQFTKKLPLRLDPNRALRKFVIDLAPDEAPFIEGSLTADSHFRTKEDLINAANDRVEWQGLAKQLEW